MEEIGAKRKNITAIVGPTIQKNSYEIKEDVANIVKETFFFKKNKGYGTKEHLDAIKQIGSCKIHRKSFKGVIT